METEFRLEPGSGGALPAILALVALLWAFARARSELRGFELIPAIPGRERILREARTSILLKYGYALAAVGLVCIVTYGLAEPQVAIPTAAALIGVGLLAAAITGRPVPTMGGWSVRRAWNFRDEDGEIDWSAWARAERSRATTGTFRVVAAVTGIALVGVVGAGYWMAHRHDRRNADRRERVEAGDRVERQVETGLAAYGVTYVSAYRQEGVDASGRPKPGIIYVTMGPGATEHSPQELAAAVREVLSADPPKGHWLITVSGPPFPAEVEWP